MSLRQLVESRLPSREALSNHRLLRLFAHRLHEPHLWHFGRRVVARSIGYGVYVAFFPIPIHMLMVLPLALTRRLNLAVLVATIWISNPLTLVPMFYFAYRVGLLLLGAPPLPSEALHFSLHWDDLATTFRGIWQPLVLGTAVCGVAFGVLASRLVDWLWQAAIRRRWRERRAGEA